MYSRSLRGSLSSIRARLIPASAGWHRVPLHAAPVGPPGPYGVEDMANSEAARFDAFLTYLRGRFRALRAAGPIRVAMVSRRFGQTIDDSRGRLPLEWDFRNGVVEMFADMTLSTAHRTEVQQVTDGDLFFHCDRPAFQAFIGVSEDAAPVVVSVASLLGVEWAYKHDPDCHTRGAMWLWLLFEVAAAALPGILLRLSRDLWSRNQPVGVRELRDVVEASIIVLDAAMAAGPKASKEEPAHNEDLPDGSKPVGNPVGRPPIDADFDRAIRLEWLDWKGTYDGDGSPTIAAFIEWRITKMETEKRNGKRLTDNARARMAADWDDAIERGRKQIERITKASKP